MKKYVLVITLLTGLQLAAQEKIETDRPDQTETPVLVPKKYLQAELGFNKEKTTREITQYLHPTALIKYGWRNRVELRLETNLATEQQRLVPNSKSASGLQAVEPGIKIALAEEKGLRPKTSFIAHVGLPFFAVHHFSTPHLAPSFRVTLQNTLTKNIGLGYNLGAEWDGFSSTPIWLYTLAPGFNLGERWYAYAEAFGFIQKGRKPLHNLDGGIAYFITNHTKADLSAGIGLSSSSFDYYAALGFSFRLPLVKNKAEYKLGLQNP